MYVEATKLDQYLAVAYFQEGVSNFLLGEFEEALGNFNDALLVVPRRSPKLILSTFAETFASIMNNSVSNSGCTPAKYCSIADYVTST